MEEKFRTVVNIHVCGGGGEGASSPRLSQLHSPPPPLRGGGGTAPVRSSLDKGDLPTFLFSGHLT